MKITTIYNQKIQSLKNDIIDSILTYFKVLDIKKVTIKNEEKFFLLTVDKIAIHTSDNEDYILYELQIETLLFILEKLENIDYIKNE